jgi:hypothetical protein
MMMLGATGQAVCYIMISALLSRAGQSNSTEEGTTTRTAQEAKFGAASVAFFFLYYAFLKSYINTVSGLSSEKTHIHKS